MKGRVYKRGKIWYLPVRHRARPADRQASTGERERVHDRARGMERMPGRDGRLREGPPGQVHLAARSVDALDEWLTRIEHSIKPSMAQNWRNYAAYYVIPYIGQRDVQDINGAVCDALYAKLLAEGRVKAKPKKRPSTQPVHVRRLAADGRVLPCRPYGYDMVRCYRTHAPNDPLLGQPIKSRKLGRRAAEDACEAAQRKLSPGLEPKTVVNTHRMLHRAWEDFAVWGWAKRNVVSDAHPPRVPRKGRKVWTVAQLRLSCSAPGLTGSLRCGCSKPPRACGAASWRARGVTCSTWTPERSRSRPTRVVVDGRVIESDGKTENAQHVLALDPFTLAALKVHV